MLFYLSLERGESMNWQPIETAPIRSIPNKMFAVIAKTTTPVNDPYITDPYYVWREADGSFSRWPHSFMPTHWHPMPQFDDN